MAVRHSHNEKEKKEEEEEEEEEEKMMRAQRKNFGKKKSVEKPIKIICMIEY